MDVLGDIDLTSTDFGTLTAISAVVEDDWTSTAIQVLDYYPYGSTRISQTTGGYNEGKQFIGQYTDPETSLSYLQARYMDNGKGTFLSEDPVFLGDPKQQALTDPQSLNSYSYANDNPITQSDPAGLASSAAWRNDPFRTSYYEAILGSIASVAALGGKPATAALLMHSLSLNPGDISAGNGSVYVNAITSSPEYQTKLQSALQAASSKGASLNNYDIGLSSKEGDAGSAFHLIDLYVSGSQDKFGVWSLSVHGSDPYDFDNKQKTGFVTNTANGLAYKGQQQGAVSNFTTYFSFTQAITSPRTFTTPSGAVVDSSGHLISGPTKKM